MYKHIRAVALRTVRYNDTKAILTAWSAELGRISLLMPATDSRESRRRRALTMPMSLFEGEVDVRPGRDILSVRDMRAAAVTPSLSADFGKATVAMFMAECLDSMLREAAVGDEALWELIRETVTGLDLSTDPAAIANTHLWFLYRLCALTGVEPDSATYRPGRLFDLRSGTFRDSAPGHTDYVEAAQAPFLVALARLTPRTLHLMHLTADARNAALDLILRYCSLHALTPGPLNTLSVLRSLFR